jgi:hypothetical protein
MGTGNDSHTVDFDETFFGMNPDNMCSHPFKRGLSVTKEQAGVAFQV